MEEKLVFTKAEFDAAVPKVVAEMRSFLSGYRTPVFRDRGNYGEGWGSGSYIRLGERQVILSNEHVASVRRQGETLLHQFLDDDSLYKVLGDHAEFPAPLDLAILPVSDRAWNATKHQSNAILIDQIALV